MKINSCTNSKRSGTLTVLIPHVITLYIIRKSLKKYMSIFLKCGVVIMILYTTSSQWSASIFNLTSSVQVDNSDWTFGTNKLYVSIGHPRSVMVKVLDSGIVVSKFELQSRYCVHFQTNTQGKGMDPLFSQLWVKYHHSCSSRRMYLALTNPRRLMFH